MFLNMKSNISYFKKLYCTSELGPLLSPLPSIFGLWNCASSVGGRKKHEFGLICFVLGVLVLRSYFYLRLRVQKRKKDIGSHLCLKLTRPSVDRKERKKGKFSKLFVLKVSMFLINSDVNKMVFLYLI
jgi:hypothetical protein